MDERKYPLGCSLHDTFVDIEVRQRTTSIGLGQVVPWSVDFRGLEHCVAPQIHSRSVALHGPGKNHPFTFRSEGLIEVVQADFRCGRRQHHLCLVTSRETIGRADFGVLHDFLDVVEEVEGGEVFFSVQLDVYMF